MRLHWWAVLAVPLLGVGCSLLTNLDDLSGGSADAAPDTALDGAEEAAADAAPDAPQPGDASADASADAPFCGAMEDGEVFCADFDQNKPVDWGWNGSSSSTTDGGALDLDLDASVSPPASMRASTFATNAGQEYKYLTRNLAAVTSYVHLQFQLRVDAADSVIPTLVAMLSFGTGSTYNMALRVQSSGANLQEGVPIDGGTTHSYVESPQFVAYPTVGSWTRVDLNVTFSPSAQVSVAFDGTVAYTHALAPGYFSGPLAVELGVVYSTSPGALEMHFDNVRVDAQ